MLHIWLITSQFPPSPGGIARYVANAAEMLTHAGAQVTVIAADGQQDEETELASGARLVRFAPRARLLNMPTTGSSANHPAFPYNLMDYWAALSYELAERVVALVERFGAPDLIECQEYAALPYFLLQRKLVEPDYPLARVPVLLHLHSPDFSIARANQEPRFRLPRYWVGQMEKFCMLAADALLSPSRYLAEDVTRELPQVAGQIDIIPLPYPPLVPVENDPMPGDVVFFGRLEARKGVLELAHACARLWERGHTFRLTLIGDDTAFVPLGQSVGTVLRQRHARWVVEGRLVLVEHLAQSALRQRLASAWALIVPSLWENFPNTCIEAMLLGKLVVASRAGGQAEMIGDDGQAGLLFSWEDLGSCEAAIEQALALHIGEVHAIGARARARIVALTSFEAVLPQRLAHYERVIARTRTARRHFPCVTPGVEGHVLPPNPASTIGLLSVVVPFYNLGNYIEETVASILASSYRPLEVIILDDGSNDPASLQVLEQVERRYAGLLRVEQRANEGLATARNLGAETARGEFVAFVDADDLVEPLFFERALAVLHRYQNVSFVYSWVRFFGESDDCWPCWNTELPYLLGHNMLTAFVVARRSDFLAHGRNSATLAYAMEDYDAWIGMVEQGCIGVSLPEPLVRYRLRPGSMSRRISDDQALYLLDIITQRHPDLYRRFGAELFGLLNANGRSIGWDHPARSVDQPDVRALRQYASDLQQQHADLSDMWQQQRVHIAALEQQLHEMERWPWRVYGAKLRRCLDALRKR